MSVDETARDELMHDVDELLKGGHPVSEVRQALQAVASPKNGADKTSILRGAHSLIAQLRATRETLPHGV